jgi:uncharacterized membrane protein YkvA (DUF1232 family)
VDPSWIASALLALLVLWASLLAILWLVRPRDVALHELVRVVPDILRLVRRLLTDRSAPLGVRLALLALLAWLINPIDLVPEFIPVLGPLDDVVVAVLVLRYARRRLGDRAFRAHWPGTPAGYDLVSRVLGVPRAAA